MKTTPLASRRHAIEKREGSSGVTVEELTYRMQRLRDEVRRACHESTCALVAAVQAKDPQMKVHSTTVAYYATAIGRRVGLNESMLRTLRAASLLHDVGKIGVPDAILHKPGPLTPDEYDLIKKHPETGLEILVHIRFLHDERAVILHHHERHDGTGYPAGLAGDRIPIGARVLAVADAIDTMLSPRTYKQPYSLDRVRSELVGGAGRQFDPAIAHAALQWLDEAGIDLPHTVAAA